MRFKFLGGADIVGRMGMLLENRGASMIFEYGMNVAKPPTYPLPAPPVEIGLLTHSHLDHCGMIPWLCGRYDTKFIATPCTISVAKLLLEDSLKVAELEGFPKPFETPDIRSAMRNFIPMEFGETVDVAGLEVELHSAGHVPGATMYELRGDQTTVFSGDLNTTNTRLVWGAHPVRCDNLIMESTYAGRRQPDRLKTEFAFQEKVKEVVERGGKAVIACFAVGRSQEMMLVLKDLKYDMWIDGMSKTVNRLYIEHPEFLRNDKHLRKAMRRFREVRAPSQRDMAMKGEVIVTTGGMLDGGPVLSYLQSIKDDRKSALLLTGYQAEDSNGRALLERGVINDRGVDIKVNCEVARFDFSAHCDHDALVRFVEACNPENVVLCHGENREELAMDLDGRNVILPHVGEWHEL